MPSLIREHSRAAAPTGGRRAAVAAMALWTARGLLLALVAILPWAFGGVRTDVQLATAVAIAVAMLATLGWRWTAGGGRPLPRALLPLAVLAAWAAVQLVPMPAAVVSRASPAAAELRGEFGSILPAGDAWSPLNLYPASGRRDLALVILAIAVFWLGSQVFVSSRAVVLLLIVTAASGAALSFVDLARQLAHGNDPSWRVGWVGSSDVFGPFVNRNHAAACFNLSLGAALGLAAWLFVRRRTNAYSSLASRFAEQVSGQSIAVVAAAAALVCGVLCTLSRGGAVSMAAGLALVLAALMVTRGARGRALVLSAAVLAGAALVLWVGMSGRIGARLSSVVATDAARGRLTHWEDGLRTAAHFPLVGSGLGSYRCAYRPYQQNAYAQWYYHAESHYLEALVELGVPGLLLVVAAMGLVGVAAWRLVRRSSDEAGRAIGVAALFAFGSQAVHAGVDFALFMPANVLFVALLGGAACGVAAPALERRSVGSLGRMVLAGGLLAALVWATVQTYTAATVDRARRQAAELERTKPEPARAELRAAVERLSSALLRQPDDTEALEHLVQLRLAIYRAEALERLKRENAGRIAEAELPNFAATAFVYRRAQRFFAAGAEVEVQRLRDDPLVVEHLRPAAAAAAAAIAGCPLSAPAQLAAAELGFLFSPPQMDIGPALGRALRLAPYHSAVWLRSGELYYHAGRTEEACKAWHRGLVLSPPHLLEQNLESVWRVAEETLSAEEIAAEVLAPSPELIVGYARQRFPRDTQRAVRRALARQAARLLETEKIPPAQREKLQGELRRLEGG